MTLDEIAKQIEVASQRNLIRLAPTEIAPTSLPLGWEPPKGYHYETDSEFAERIKASQNARAPLSKSDRDIMETALALCLARHPSPDKSVDGYCDGCMDLTMVAVGKLEELGWQDSVSIRQGMRDAVDNAMDEG